MEVENRSMDKVKGLKCTGCGREYDSTGMRYVCEKCGKNLDVVYDYAVIRKRLNRKSLAGNPDYSVWRYWDLYPLSDRSNIMPLAIGWTGSR